mmetsp:Transcript_3728/g.8651  ORF Transcript_3728/g.8651 Transcript_3728/m.8651 type:complete len:279 (-) Transcript_3728:135-971(-)|eukprot:CAMPEP_0171092060 /NCGR_PEP_ID=MMETSP0766_2-20121228/35474_1 /TAXON_ID=439317 /ORGANISM="Gambierdiscus australes, Strain CAWD 149" /LENGTH=278 /DNA_ID=CAMNT_0011550255 /DNA_START=71 /DNA_END=907 /DNA_ORIENTATION=-
MGQDYNSRPQNSGRKKPSRSFDSITIVLLPWFVFALILCLFVFVYDEFAPLVWSLLTVSLLWAVLLIGTGASRTSWHLALGMFMIAAVAVGVPIGLFIARTHMRDYWRLDSGAMYRELDPSESSALHSDATIIEFRKGSTVDVQRSVGYMRAGRVYCVAPVMSKNPGRPHVQYWAAGVNCCKTRGEFKCNDSGNPKARSGLTIDDRDGSFSNAVRMAGSVHDIELADTEPVLVTWTDNALAYKKGLWVGAASLVVVSAAIHLLMSSFAGLVVLKYVPM